MSFPKRFLISRRQAGQFMAQVLAILVAFIFLVPILWMVTSSFKAPKDILLMPPKWIYQPTLDNYRAVLLGERNISGATFPEVKDFPRFIGNSVIIGLSSTFIALLIGTPAAYTIERYKFRGKKQLAFYILGARMAPPLAVLIPYYILFSWLHLIDNYLTLLIVYSVLNLPFVIWMMRGFFREVPQELEDAARVDGCDRYGALFHVAFPLVAPGFAATAIFCLLLSWNEFLFALILTGNVAKTAPVAMYSFISFHEVIWGALFAAGTLVTLPVLIFALLVQRNLVRGLTMGAFK